MANRIFEYLLEEKITNFKNGFKNVSKNVFWNEETKKLTHPGEYGYYREIICKDFIRFLIPRRLNIDTGFLINTADTVSTQCDIIVFDGNSTPLIENNERQRFYPVETIAAIGEVKSVLTKTKLIEAINKLAEIKQMRDKTSSSVSFVRREHKGNYDPSNYQFDSIFSFIICEKLDFDISNICDLITESYDKKYKPHNKHNLILSIEDGLLTYNYFDSELKNNKCIPWPIFNTSLLKNLFLVQTENNDHIRYFASCLFQGTSSASILFPDTVNYMKPTHGGEFKIEQ